MKNSDSAHSLSSFSRPTRSWFEAAFPEPTRVQRLGWPTLAAGSHALLVAPTGSGKTLAAFLWAIDQTSRLPEDAPEGVRVLYVSPLKALVYDIERNLRAPLIGIQRAAQKLGEPVRQSRVDIRTGDTPQRDRRRQLKHPGDILVTTPESLFLLLGSQAAATLATVHTVIVDEIHVFAPSKRGAHLALSLERLSEVTQQPVDGELQQVEPQRIGLSATVRPVDEVARFLGGRTTSSAEKDRGLSLRPVEVVDASEPAHIALEVVVPVADMEAPPPPAALSGSSIGGAGGPVDGSEPIDVGGPLLAELEKVERSEGWRGPESGGVWPSIYPRLVELILQHRSTIVFVNSRGLCERLSQRLNDAAAEVLEAEALAAGSDDSEETEPPVLVRAHHGSLSHQRRGEIEEALKAGSLRAIVATSSLELGIDMGAVDLVILVESPGSAARGLQRVGRAGHGVGELSRGVIFPKFKGDLLECAVVAGRMLEGTLEPVRVPQNPLDVLAQQIVAYCAAASRTVAEIEALARRAHPFHTLSTDVLIAVLDMLSGRYPSDELADLRPRLSWDRSQDVLSARRGAQRLTLLNAGTIPDRGLYGVHLGEGGPRVGELDEEMVYESRAGDTIILGASTWRVLEITRDRVIVAPAPGEPGRMPFWHGDGPGRPIELGRSIGAFLRRIGALDESAATELLRAETPLDDYAVENLVGYLEEQKEQTGTLPTDRSIVIERFRDELGDWRVCLLTPFGSRVHAPWAMALQRQLSERAGYDVETMYTDDGIVLRFPDTEQLPETDDLMPDPEEVEDLVVEQVGRSALFASHFRENAARALLLPRNRPGKRTPLWQQRLRAKHLLASVQRFSDFPIVLESYRECLRDIFDLPALIELLHGIRSRQIRVDDVETSSASPFARSLVFAYVAQYLYEQDSPLAERKAQALTLDRHLLRELLGQSELRELIDAEALAEVEAELQSLAPESLARESPAPESSDKDSKVNETHGYDRRARDADELHDMLRRLGDLTPGEIEERSVGDPGPWLERLVNERRACRVRVAAEDRWIATDDVARYRDALGVAPPGGLPDSFLVAEEAPLEALIRRYARTHGPFVSTQVGERFGLLAAQVEPILESLLASERMVRGEIRPGGRGLEWCDPGVLRRIKRRTLGRLRDQVAPVDASALGRFLPRWGRVEAGVAVASTPDPSTARQTRARPTPARSTHRFGRKLEDAVAQLEGLALPWSSLCSAILPARVERLDLDELDRLAASGQLVWVGRGALGTRDGRVALYRRDRAAALIRGPEDYEPSSDLHRAILDHLRQRGASFTFELERLPALSSVGVDRSRELEATLWDLVWDGVLTNDTFLPLRNLGGRRKQTAKAQPFSASRRRKSAGTGGRALSRRGPVGLARSRRGSREALSGGRWSLVEDLRQWDLDDASTGVSETEWAHATAVMLLDRYGVVSREVALAEDVRGGFAAIYPILREMEDAGRVRRGYFVEGLSGRQFAMPGAVEELRAAREEEIRHDSIEILASIDPANPYGALLPWPERRRPEGPGPRRVAGAWVVLRSGEPVLFLESGGRAVVTFRGLEDEAVAGPAIDALSAVARRQRKRSLRLLKIDGEPATKSELAPLFQRHGFDADYQGLRWVQ